MKGIIYKATNLFDGKVYIGQTITTLSRRRAQHLRDSRHDHQNDFHRALYQYNSAFVWEVLDTFSGKIEDVMHKLNVAEEYHIIKHDSSNPEHGYNSTKGGYSSGIFSEHIKRRFCSFSKPMMPIAAYDTSGKLVNVYKSKREAKDDLGVSATTINRSISMNTSEIYPSISRFVFRYAIEPVPRTLAITIKHRKNDEEKYTKKMEHRIIQYTLDGEFVKVWDNAHRAAQDGADSQTYIRLILNGHAPKKKPNYQWRYYDEEYPLNIGPYSTNKTHPESFSRSDDTIAEIDWKGNTVATYRDTADAAEKSGFSQSYICNVLAGRIRHPKRKFKRIA